MCYLRNILGLFILFLSSHAFCVGKHEEINIPKPLNEFLKSISYSDNFQTKPNVELKLIRKNLYHISFRWTLSNSVQLDKWEIQFKPNYEPNFHWAPHLTPSHNHIIAQHVFRSPALIVKSQKHWLSIIPDLDLLKEKPSVEWFMDMDAQNNSLHLGLAKSKITDLILYEKEVESIFPEGEYKIAAYILVSNNKTEIENPFALVNQFFWSKWGKSTFQNSDPLSNNNIEKYIDRTYQWAFKNWRNSVWQEFKIENKQVGAPAFIVNVSQSPNYPGYVNEREFRSIWNQAWFNSLRSAMGLYRYAKRKNIDSLITYANKTKELALSIPNKKGFFYGLIATEMEEVNIENIKVNRSKGWNTRYFGNSNRNPFTWDPKKAPFHVLDMSYTAFIMLNWYSELEKDNRLLEYAKFYADALILKQRIDGHFPAWLDLDSLEDLEILSDSPETAMSVTFLMKLYKLTNIKRYKDSAIKAFSALENGIINEGRWEDFETYWSCSGFGKDTYVGKKILRNNMYKQNTLSMYYVSEAALSIYQETKDKRFLKIGNRVLDELLMWQAVWQPSFIYIPAIGGFGVMNADAEWNDSRQSLFANLIYEYAKILNRKDYEERAIAAIRASFVLMYCPENKVSKLQWENKWPFLKEEDYGFMMENYGHDGVTNPNGIGIGEFTIYDWGNGAAAEAANKMIDKWGLSVLNKDLIKK